KKMPQLVSDEAIDVMVIAVPARVAQKVLNQIMSAGIKAVLNFAPASLSARLDVKVKTVDLSTSLESLSYYLARPPRQGRTKTQQQEVVAPEDMARSGTRQL